MNNINEAFSIHREQVKTGEESLLETTSFEARTYRKWLTLFPSRHLIGWDCELMHRIIETQPQDLPMFRGSRLMRPIQVFKGSHGQKYITISVWDTTRADRDPFLVQFTFIKDEEWSFCIPKNPDPDDYQDGDLKQRVRSILNGADDRFKLAFHTKRFFPIESSFFENESRTSVEDDISALNQLDRTATILEFRQIMEPRTASLPSSCVVIDQIALTYGQFPSGIKKTGNISVEWMDCPMVLDRWGEQLFIALRTTKRRWIKEEAFNIILIPTEMGAPTSAWTTGHIKCGLFSSMKTDYPSLDLWDKVFQLIQKGEVHQKSNGQILLKW